MNYFYRYMLCLIIFYMLFNGCIIAQENINDTNTVGNFIINKHCGDSIQASKNIRFLLTTILNYNYYSHNFNMDALEKRKRFPLYPYEDDSLISVDLIPEFIDVSDLFGSGEELIDTFYLGKLRGYKKLCFYHVSSGVTFQVTEIKMFNDFTEKYFSYLDQMQRSKLFLLMLPEFESFKLVKVKGDNNSFVDTSFFNTKLYNIPDHSHVSKYKRINQKNKVLLYMVNSDSEVFRVRIFLSNSGDIKKYRIKKVDQLDYDLIHW